MGTMRTARKEANTFSSQMLSQKESGASAHFSRSGEMKKRESLMKGT
jgi:hypothetical protein